MANLRRQTHTFSLHYLFAIDANGGNPTQYSREVEVLAGLFLPTDGDDDDDASTWLTAPAGFVVEEVTVTGVDRLFDLDEHNLGHGQVTVTIQGHTYSKCPINALATAIDTRVHTNRAAFTPDLALVTRDDYWQQNVEGMATRVPCVVTQHDGTTSETTNF